jgi:hypothetical protein
MGSTQKYEDGMSGHMLIFLLIGSTAAWWVFHGRKRFNASLKQSDGVSIEAPNTAKYSAEPTNGNNVVAKKDGEIQK